MKYLSKKELRLPKRKKKSKKGDSGRVLIIGGSKEYVGAVTLTGLAALRCGCDWVTIAAPEKVAWAINSLSADLITHKVKGDYFKRSHVPSMIKLSQHFDVIVLGNGIGMKAKAFVQSFVQKCKKPLVIDADALKVIDLKKINHAILTPHAKEFEMLMKNSSIKNKNQLKKILRDNVLIVKGPIDVIYTQSKTLYNKTGNPGMTKAGTGDVLVGLCGGFYAQTRNLVQSAKLGVFYNGLIGDILLHKKKGFTYLASDMVEEIIKIHGK